MKTNLLLSAWVLFFILPVGMSCSKDKTMVAASSANTVSMKSMAFNPSTLEVVSGTTVRWVNNDNIPYNVISDDDVFNSGAIQPGQSYSHTFSEGGTFNYHCSLYVDMTGTVIVNSPQ